MSEQRAVLRQYLLGELPERERSQLANQYFIDENLFDELLDIESELLDQYARGQLAPEETRNFRDYLAGLPDGSTKLATAYALKEARNEIRHRTPATFDEVSSAAASQILPSRSQILPALLFNRTPKLQYVSVAIVIGLLCGLAYVLIARRALQREVELLRAEQTHAEQEKVNSAQQARIAQENEAALRDRNLQLAQELSELKQTIGTQKREAHETALLVLTPALRSGASLDSLTISDTTKTVLLVMPTAKDEPIGTYRVLLKTTAGRLVLTRDRLKSQMLDERSTVSLRLSAAQFTPDTYKLMLRGQGTDGIETAQDFYFKIVKE